MKHLILIALFSTLPFSPIVAQRKFRRRALRCSKSSKPRDKSERSRPKPWERLCKKSSHPLYSFLSPSLQIALFIKVQKAISAAKLFADDERHTYLGTIEDEFAADSIFNEFGTHGSPFSSDSIWNEFGDFGGEFSLRAHSINLACRLR